MSKTRLGLFQISGVIVASDWDEKGRITAIKLNDYHEQEFRIPCSDYYVGLVTKKVVLEGMIYIDRNGDLIMRPLKLVSGG